MGDDTKISAADPHPRKRLELLNSWMSYADTGAGDPVVFLHGNPTSSYLWRNVIPYLAPHARCVAPDLIGMGASGPSATGTYRFADHARYLDAFFEALNLKRNVTLVVHDWGSALGFHWAARHPDAIKGIAYMEAIVRPLQWSEWSQQAVAIFKALRSPAGDEMILKNNIFVERILPGSIIRKLSAEEMDAYRKPYLQPGESRRPTLSWPREIPLEGEPADVVAIADSYSKWLEQSCDAEVVRQCRARRDPHRRATRVLQAMAESARGHGQGHSLHPGRFAARNRTRARRLVPVDRQKNNRCPSPRFPALDRCRRALYLTHRLFN